MPGSVADFCSYCGGCALRGLVVGVGLFCACCHGNKSVLARLCQHEARFGSWPAQLERRKLFHSMYYSLKLRAPVL